MSGTLRIQVGSTPATPPTGYTELYVDSVTKKVQTIDDVGAISTITGDVNGPASATDGRIVRFDGATGKLLKQSTATVSDAELGHVVGVTSAIQTQLNAKLPTASFTDAAVTGKLITGYVSGTGTVAATDSILQAIQKLDGNDAIISVANRAAHSTGLKTGGVLSIGTGGAGVATTFTIALGVGLIVDNTVIPATLSEISWTAKTDVAVTNIGTQPLTFIALDSGGSVIQQATDFTDAQHRLYIVIGTVVHTNLTTVTVVNQGQHLAISPQSQLNDLMQSIAGFNSSGNLFSANGANLNINKSAGILFKQGSNYANSANAPNSVTTASLTAASFRYNNQTGAASATLTAIDPSNYDNAGTTTAVPVNKFTTQRIFLFTSNLLAIQRGQTVYNSLAEAKAAIQNESFVVNSSISPNGVLRAFLIVKQGATALNSATDAFFLEAPKFGGTSGVGGLSVSTLQNAYDNSTSPEILTDATRLALSIRRGSGADTDNILEGLNGAGTITFTLKGNGAGAFSGAVTGSNLSGTNTGDPTIVSVAGDVTLTANATHLVSSAASRNLTLPAHVAGQMLSVTDSTGDCETNNFTVIRTGGGNLSGLAASRILRTNWGSWKFVDDGTNWVIL